MRVIELRSFDTTDYCCNVYWVLGEHNSSYDVNTLIDLGSTSQRSIERICRGMEEHSKGIGKGAVEQVVLTHAHYDHSGGLPAIIERFHPVVHAFARGAGVDRLLVDGQAIKIGDRVFEVIHLPGHSDDSICLYCAAERALFSGDALGFADAPRSPATAAFLGALERLASREISTIYPGHGAVVTRNAGCLMRELVQKTRRQGQEG